jgi:hypothetical protein
MKRVKVYVIFLVTTLLMGWLLGVLRFENVFFDILFKVIFFPFGFLYALYESYCTGAFSSSSCFNNEFLQIILFVICLIMQSLLYYLIYYKVRKDKQSQK